jgi:hypothetical protein
MLKPFYVLMNLGLKVVLKYISRKIATRVFSGRQINERIVKNIKADHLSTKAKYKFKISLFGLLAIKRTAVNANKYPTNIAWANIGNSTNDIKRPMADNRLFFKVLIL